jgi:hypothetical protein
MRLLQVAASTVGSFRQPFARLVRSKYETVGGVSM